MSKTLVIEKEKLLEENERLKRQLAEHYDLLPWNDAKTWEPDWWYPLPVGSMWVDNPNITFHEAYNIFKLSDFKKGSPLYGDIESVIGIDLSLREAVLICEAHNGEKFKAIEKINAEQAVKKFQSWLEPKEES